ncbi:hypothetical protein [Rathayibacter sp. SD072]|uniref:hypothetical protein n=1 Tax=Rathayibacter sp. SD072 TaxID=2781731 RepID=UPI001A95EFDD|nr:hypothetical protein [Rathayibacter sp. SD072]MBO0983069.1 hypothetical protein [Rathayibacter sp. SD072]
MRLRSRRPAVLVLSLVVVLAGCSSEPVVEIPEQSGATAVITPTPVPAEPTAAAQPVLDCATVLPASRIEESTGLPTRSVALVGDGRRCTYSVAGNPSALEVTLAPARLLETFVGAGEAVGATPVPLGDAGYRVDRDAGASQPGELAIQAGGYEVRIVSHLGDSAAALDWAETVLAAAGVRL